MRNFNWNSELRFQFKRKRNSPTPYKSNIDVFGFFIDCGIQKFCKILNISLLFFVGPCFRPSGALNISIIYMFTRNLYDEQIMGYKLCNKIWSLPIKLQALLTTQWRGWYFILKVRTLPDNRQSYHVVDWLTTLPDCKKHFPNKSSAFNPVTCN